MTTSRAWQSPPEVLGGQVALRSLSDHDVERVARRTVELLVDHVPAMPVLGGIREVDLTPVLRDALVAHRAWMASAGFDVSPRARVYQSGAGGPLSPSNVRRMLRVLRGQTNERREARGLNPLPHVTPHTLRRTYTSILLLASGGDVEYVMSQVGHADAETTMRIYSQLLKRAKRDHGKAFDSLVADARDTVLGSHGEPVNPSEKTDRSIPNWHTNLAQIAQKGAGRRSVRMGRHRNSVGLAGVF